MAEEIHQLQGSAGLCADTERAKPADAEALFRRYSAYVAGIAYRILGREDGVDDVVQDVFSEVVRGIGRLRDPASAKDWLSVIAVRSASRHLRRRRALRFFGFDEGHDYGDVVFEGASPEHVVQLGRIYSILDGLPVGERVAWSLRYIEEESVREVARLCSCSMATANRRIASAQRAVIRGLSDGKR